MQSMTGESLSVPQWPGQIVKCCLQIYAESASEWRMGLFLGPIPIWPTHLVHSPSGGQEFQLFVFN